MLSDYRCAAVRYKYSKPMRSLEINFEHLSVRKALKALGSSLESWASAATRCYVLV